MADQFWSCTKGSRAVARAFHGRCRCTSRLTIRTEFCRCAPVQDGRHSMVVTYRKESYLWKTLSYKSWDVGAGKCGTTHIFHFPSVIVVLEFSATALEVLVSQYGVIPYGMFVFLNARRENALRPNAMKADDKAAANSAVPKSQKQKAKASTKAGSKAKASKAAGRSKASKKAERR